MGDQGKNVIIGVFVLVAFAVVVFILLFLHPSTGDEGQVLRVLFIDIDKVNIGTRVTFAGKAVGEVREIIEVEHDRVGPADDEGHLYVYELVLRIDSKLRVYSTDIISLRTSGLLGERSVAIIPVLPPAGHKGHIVTSDELLYANQTGSVEDVMQEFKLVAGKLDIALDQATLILQDVRKEELVKKISNTIQNMSEITDALNQPDELAAIVTNMQDFTSQLANRLPASWDTFDQSLHELRTTTVNARDFSNTLNDLAADVRHGKGTVGKLVVDDDIYLQVKAILGKVDTLANDVNHYGMLFHLDKGWQRMRARRLNLMQKLSTPQEFRNYFNDEVDQISTSLSRVSMVLDKTEEMCPPCCLVENKEFSKVFAELLRRMETMEESLRLYNQQIAECAFEQTEFMDYCQ